MLINLQKVDFACRNYFKWEDQSRHKSYIDIFMTEIKEWPIFPNLVSDDIHVFDGRIKNGVHGMNSRIFQTD